MTTTAAQNKAHHTDAGWIKSNGRGFTVDGEHYISEYVSPFTGQAIRKSWRMTGRDWFVFDADGTRHPYGHATLTIAKYEASA